jgi:hypothetical protein
MMESYDPEVAHSTMQFDTLVQENRRLAEEVKQLRALLVQNNIPIPTDSQNTVARDSEPSPGLCNKNGLSDLEGDKLLPELPMEIMLRILDYGVTSPTPLIDPFHKLRRGNITKAERSSRKHINIALLAISKAFNIEGNRLLLENNELIFTQASALERFAKVSAAHRVNIENITIRCVGRYYYDKQQKLNLDGDSIYHESVSRFIVPTLPRPVGLVNDSGIQAYCWYQVADFLKALRLPLDPDTQLCPKLFPSLKRLRLDLVNFCDHLPLGIWSFASIVRWHLGPICDDLLITGIPEVEGGADEETLLRNLLRDEGLISTGCPVFISSSSGLKSLEGYGYSQQVVRANEIFSPKAKAAKFTHPEGGEAPMTTYAQGTTVWKWTADHANGQNKWVEFDRVTGYPMDEINPLRGDSDDEEGDDDDDEDDEDGSQGTWGDDDDEADSYDEDGIDFFPHTLDFLSFVGYDSPTAF